MLEPLLHDLLRSILKTLQILKPDAIGLYSYQDDEILLLKILHMLDIGHKDIKLELTCTLPF